MKLNKTLIAAGIALAAVQAHAALSFSATAASGSFAVPLFSTPDGTLAYTAFDSVPDLRLAPLGVTGSYLAVTAGGLATVEAGGASSFSFLWGSPDTYNFITIDRSDLPFDEVFAGTALGALGFAAEGSNAGTTLFTITATDGTTIERVNFGSDGVAFELAVASAVPELQIYAMLLAGLGATALMVRRRRED